MHKLLVRVVTWRAVPLVIATFRRWSGDRTDRKTRSMNGRASSNRRSWRHLRLTFAADLVFSEGSDASKTGMLASHYAWGTLMGAVLREATQRMMISLVGRRSRHRTMKQSIAGCWRLWRKRAWKRSLSVTYRKP
jgi:hypothetical protein